MTTIYTRNPVLSSGGISPKKGTVGHVDGGTTALAELATFEVEVFMVTGDKTPSP